MLKVDAELLVSVGLLPKVKLVPPLSVKLAVLPLPKVMLLTLWAPEIVTVEAVVLKPELAEPKLTSSVLVMGVLAPALEPVASVLQKVSVPQVPVGKAVKPGVAPSASQK
jgi:hypothetical protein